MVAAMVYGRYRKMVIVYFIGCEVGLTLLTFSFTVRLLLSIAEFHQQEYNLVLRHLAYGASLLGIVLNICIVPYFFHSLLGRSVSKWLSGVFLLVTSIAAISAIAFVVTSDFIYAIYILNPIQILTILYGLAITVLYYSSIGDIILKRVLKTVVMVTGIFLPFIVIDMNPGLFSFMPVQQPYLTLSVPIYFFIYNILALILAVKYFNQPPFFEAGRLTDHFTNQYGISERELEIVKELLKGQTNKEIGEALFISHKTVENHLSKIYQKTGIKKRLDLINLINSNRLN